MIQNYLTEKTLPSKILLSFVVMFIILLFKSTYTLYSLDKVNKSMEAVYHTNLELEKFMKEIARPLSNIRMLSMELVLAPNKKMVNKINNDIGLKVKILDETMSKWEKNKTVEKNFDKLQLAWINYKNSLKKTRIFALNSTRIAAFISVTNDEKTSYEKILRQLRDFYDKELIGSETVFNNAKDSYTYTFLTVVFSVIVVLVILIVIGKYVLSMVWGYIRQKQIYEKEIEAVQERLTLTIAGSGDGLWEIDHTNNTLWWSPQFKDMLGYKDDEIQIKPEKWVEYLYPDDIEFSFNAFTKHLEKDIPYDVIFRMIHKNGESIWVRSRAKTLRDSDKKIIRTSGSVTNVTALKVAEEAIRQNNHHMTFVAENANLGFWSFNPQDGVTFVNDAFATMLGYEPNEIFKDGYEEDMFKPFKTGIAFWEQLLHPDDALRATKALNAHINGETDLYKVDYRMRRADGSWMWSTAIGKIAEYDDEGKAIRFNGVNLDIDDAKDAQLQIEEQQQQFTSMVSNVPGAIYRVVNDSAWPIIYMSDEIQNITGYPASDFIESKIVTFSTIMYPDDIEPIGKSIQQQFSNTNKFIVEYRVIAKSGDIVWVRSEGQLIKSESGESWIDGVLIDITEERGLKEEVELLTQLVHGSLQSASVGAWWIDFTEDNIFHGLDTTAKMIGIDFKEKDSDVLIISEWVKILEYTATLSDEYASAINDTFENFSGAISGKYDFYHAIYPIAYDNDNIKWIEARANVPKRDKTGNALLMTGTLIDITEAKKTQINLKDSHAFTQTLLDSQEQLILTTDGETLISVNESFLDFFEVDSVEEFKEQYNANCICETFNTDSPDGYLQIMMDDEKWIDYVIRTTDSITTHKAMITREETNFIFSVTAAKLPGEQGLKSAVFTNITAIEMAQQEIETIHRHTKESIEYASLIQSALIPDNQLMSNYFSDYLTIWQPKDVVGGDIYLFEELRDQNECLLMVIDCTGHGVPGAFVTMLVKAIERQIISKIENDRSIDVSPAWILSYFNRTMKKLLQQESQDSISNAGFDGGIIYYNKKEQILKFAGAETPLFYVEDAELKTIKGSRHSIGYKKSKIEYEFKEHVINVKEGMKFYLTTDGYLDQNGGNKGFPFGKKRFLEVIEEYSKEPFIDQKEILLNALTHYQGNEGRNDDITLVAFEIKESNAIEIIVEYDGVLTQGIIAHGMEVIESEISNMGIMGKVSTTIIELVQNMMHYGKIEDKNTTLEGFYEVTKDSQEIYYIRTKNIVSLEDKNKIESTLLEIESLDEASIKKRYRELRRSGEKSHGKGGGIGFYEIAKLVQEIEYNFTKIDEESYIYEFKAQISSKKVVN